MTTQHAADAVMALLVPVGRVPGDEDRTGRGHPELTLAPTVYNVD
ncbi:MAG: hypothetical protein ACRDZ0_02320 [Acidimicrobiales bacterium]